MRVCVQAWLIVGGLVAVLFLPSPYAFFNDPKSAIHSLQPRSDFLAFYSAGVLLREKPTHLYDEQKQAEIQSHLRGEKIEPDFPHFFPFVYPAVVAALYLPLTLLPYPEAFVFMLMLNVLLWGFALQLLSGRFPLNPKAMRIFVWCATLSISVILTLANGQLSFLVFILYIMLIGDIRDGRARAGFWTGLLALKPTLTPVFLLWFFWRRDWRSLIYATITGGAVVLLSLLLVGPHALSNYLGMSMKIANEQYGTVNLAQMPNLRSLLAFLGYGQIPYILLSITVLTLFFLRTRDTSDDSCIALVLTTVLLAPHLHYQELNPLWIIVAMVMRRFPGVTLGWRRILFIVASITTTAILFAFHYFGLPILPACLLVLFFIITLKPRPLVV